MHVGAERTREHGWHKLRLNGVQNVGNTVLTAEFGYVGSITSIYLCRNELRRNLVAVTNANPFDNFVGSRLGVVGDHDLFIEITGGCDFCDGVTDSAGTNKKDLHPSRLVTELRGRLQDL